MSGTGSASADPPLLDCGPPAESFGADLVAGLEASPKAVSPKHLYDRYGSRLFERICERPEYYPPEAERAILERSIVEIAEAIGPRATLIEPGAGSSEKTRWLLERLPSPVAYVPIDISREHLLDAARDLAAERPSVEVLPVCADFTAEHQLPTPSAPAERRVVFFPGSTIGNFEPDERRALLERFAGLVGDGGLAVIGIDLVKDRATLEAAYNDAEGVTAAFNKNLLVRANHELGADFDLRRFRHRAFYNEDARRIEMHLECLYAHPVSVAGRRFDFLAGETIHTENAHKFTADGFAAEAEAAGFRRRHTLTDPGERFAVVVLER